MQALLSFEKAPPFAAPLRFFLTAPLFAMLAGLLLLLDGPDLLASRWTPGALAATHLMTIGFMLQVMLGALIQILPVVAGANVEKPLRVAAVVHPGLSFGALALAAGFWFGQPDYLLFAGSLLALSISYFLLTAGRALFGVPSTSPTIRGLKLAFAALAAVLVLGCLLVGALALGWSLPLTVLVDLHAGWGFGAWASALLAAVAYVVVPMFQLTPGYPARFGWRFPVLVLGEAVLWTLASVLDLVWLAQIAQFLLALTIAGFAALTLRLQGLRRRARADASYRYWRYGLLASILAAAMMSTAALRPEIADGSAWTQVFGILTLGGLCAFIIGMLYKIVPFLGWLHLQNSGQAKVPAPPMNKLLDENLMARQMQAWLAALALLALAPLKPEWLARPAGLLFIIANGWLLFNLLKAFQAYRHHLAIIRAKLAAK